MNLDRSGPLNGDRPMEATLNQPLLVWLSLFTLVAVLAIGLYQWRRARQSQAKRGEHPGGIAGPE